MKTDPICPCCGGDGNFLGELGNLAYYRCINCGWEFSQETQKISDDYPVTDDWGIIIFIPDGG